MRQEDAVTITGVEPGPALVQFIGWLGEKLERCVEELERYYLDDLISTHDAPEGIDAFLEKRKPEWSNS